MVSFKFIHCADLHLGSRPYGIAGMDSELGKRMTEALFVSFSRIVDKALSENVDLMVISGDVFDETCETPATRYRFARQLSRLDIPVFICLGNHDHVMSWTSSIPYPNNVHVFGKDAESIILGLKTGDIEVLGISFPSAHSSADPVQSIHGRPDMFSIAVLHCSVDAVSMDEVYGPCRLSDMHNRNVDYWALGHIHKRTEISDSPYVIYPGNIQGRNRKETGPKGAYIVTVSDSHVVDTVFFPTQEVLWEDICCDIRGKDMRSLMGDIASVSEFGSVISLRLFGKGPLDPALRNDIDGFLRCVESETGCKVADIRLDTYPELDRSVLSQGDDMRARIIRVSDSMSILDRGALIDKICSTRQSSSIRYMLDWLSDEELHAMVHDAETMLVDSFTGGLD